MHKRLLIAAVTMAILLASGPIVQAHVPAPLVSMTLDLDTHDATRGLFHVHERIPVTPGPLTLDYPKWIPGEHAPVGPIVNVSGFVLRGGSTTIPWRRDLVDLYAIHLDVPAGVTSLDVAFDVFGAPVGGYSDARFATANMLVVNWNKVLLVPHEPDYRTIVITPTLHLPAADWHYATALETQSQAGADVMFAPATMETLVDSPLDAGLVFKRWSLGSIDGAPVDLAAFADTPDELDASDATIAKLRNLVAEMAALYRARHFAHYTFLLTVSDVLPGNGVEHHQSSDDGTRGDFLTDASALTINADLLPHEFNHSWDGKFRRPADLATPNLQDPMQDDLLWVYEGMTQYYGDVQAARSGLRTAEQWRQKLALASAALNRETGRLVRPLQDTADAASLLYGAPSAFLAARRSVDYYAEGELMWLEADLIIRRLSHGRRSLDDMARAFFGRTSTGPEVVTYTRDDIVAALAAVQPYDWAAFLRTRIDALAPHPPDPFTLGGYRIVLGPARSAYQKTLESYRHSFDDGYSIGILGNNDGTITDVIDGSPAALAGIAPRAKIVAVDDVAVGDVRARLETALIGARRGDGMLRLLVLQSGRYRSVTVTDRDGPRYPNIERVPGAPDLLDEAARPATRAGNRAL